MSGVPGGEVYDIRENCSSMQHQLPSQLLSLSYSSHIPNSSKGRNSYRGINSYPPHETNYDLANTVAGKCHDLIAKGSISKMAPSSESPALPFPAIAAAGRQYGLGLPRHALDQIPLQTEMAMQHLPSPTFSLQVCTAITTTTTTTTATTNK